MGSDRSWWDSLKLKLVLWYIKKYLNVSCKWEVRSAMIYYFEWTPKEKELIEKINNG